jgi:simple sugar transport system permease protein
LLELAFWEIVLAGAFRLGTPVALAALGETVVERAGSINLGIEGMMLSGALAGVVGATTVAGWPGGLVSGLLAGALLGLVMGLVVLKGGANQIVVGIGVSLLGAGLAAYLFKVWQPSGRSAVIVPLVPTVSIPGLRELPLVGEALFAQSWLTYGTVGLVAAMAWALRRTRPGLALRAAGDDPAAAALRGVDVVRVRLAALVTGGALAGLAGAAITVGYLGSFTDGVTAGKGYIALAVVIIGRWSPVGAALGALLFAAFESLALQAQTGASGLPVEAYTALPYLVTLAVLVATARRQHAPRALGRAFP